MLNLFAALALATSALAFSSGGDTVEANSVTCDAKLADYGDAEQLEASNAIMWWVRPAVFTTNYTLRVGDAEPSQDPTSFVPGQWMEVHIRTHVVDKQFSGLLLYAVDSNEAKIGEWELGGNTAVWLPRNAGCDGKSILHASASKFAYHEQFRFRAPANMTSTLTFRCLLKYGLAFPSLEGSFVWPNSQDLVLTNAGPAQGSGSWHSGQAGEDCLETCRGAGLGCDEATLQEVGSDSTRLRAAISGAVPTFEPMLAGCSATHPHTSAHGFLVAFRDSTCSQQSTCRASTPGMARVCPCSGSPDTETSSSSRPGASVLMILALLALPLVNSLHLPSSSLASVCLGVLMLPSCSAHNWINNPSRTGKLSMVHPCPARMPGGPPDLQVGPGQKFPVEWATGHNGYSWFAVVKAVDEGKLMGHTETMFHEYIQNASSADYMANEKKYRVYSANKAYSVGPLLYPAGSFSGEEIQRPEIFPFRFGSKDGAGLQQFEDAATHHASTLRASYTNPKYPWIVAVHGFKITHKEPKEADIANIEIPAGSPSGKYIIHWMWRGYRDCIDVNVLDKQSTDVWGTAGDIMWQRTEHCQYRNEFMRTDKFHTACFPVNTTQNASAAGALQAATRTGRFMAVNVVPWKQPKDYRFAEKPHIGTLETSSRCSFWRDRELDGAGTGGWTGFLSASTPTTRRPNDDERRTNAFVESVLPCAQPTEIECRQTGDKTPWNPAQEDDSNYCNLENGLFANTGVNWEVRYKCDVFNDLDTKLAYGFQVTPSQLIVGDHKDVSADPEDPVFYSTCYTMRQMRLFADDCPECMDPPPDNRYIFKDRCVSCEAAKQPWNPLQDSTWKPLDRDQCKECN